LRHADIVGQSRGDVALRFAGMSETELLRLLIADAGSPRTPNQNRPMVNPCGQSRSCLTLCVSGTSCSSRMCPITQIAPGPSCDSGTVAASPRIFATSPAYE
jgi:hypothetical protein